LGRPRSKIDRLPLALMAATAATLIAQPLAYRVQEYVTTTPEVEDLYIASVTRQEHGKLIVHKVETGRD
jgi:hypothetical protein